MRLLIQLDDLETVIDIIKRNGMKFTEVGLMEPYINEMGKYVPPYLEFLVCRDDFTETYHSIEGEYLL